MAPAPRCAALLAALGASGCTGQHALLVFHGIDTVQTMGMECEEIDPATRRLIGARPRAGEVLLWSVAAAGLYLYVRQWIPDRWREPIDWAAASLKATVVAHNTREGCQ